MQRRTLLGTAALLALPGVAFASAPPTIEAVRAAIMSAAKDSLFWSLDKAHDKILEALQKSGAYDWSVHVGSSSTIDVAVKLAKGEAFYYIPVSMKASDVL